MWSSRSKHSSGLRERAFAPSASIRSSATVRPLRRSTAGCVQTRVEDGETVPFSITLTDDE